MEILTNKLIKLLPELYLELKEILGNYKIEQLMILYQIRDNGGSMERPVLSRILGIDSGQAHYLIKPLIEKGLITSRRMSVISIDEITDKGDKEFERMKNVIHSFLQRRITDACK